MLTRTENSRGEPDGEFGVAEQENPDTEEGVVKRRILVTRSQAPSYLLEKPELRCRDRNRLIEPYALSAKIINPEE